MKFRLAILLIAIILLELVTAAPAPESEKTTRMVGRGKFRRPLARPSRTREADRNGNGGPRGKRSNPGGHGNGGYKTTPRLMKRPG